MIFFIVAHSFVLFLITFALGTTAELYFRKKNRIPNIGPIVAIGVVGAVLMGTLLYFANTF